MSFCVHDDGMDGQMDNQLTNNPIEKNATYKKLL